MIVKVLSSGSKGNATLITNNHITILIDAGITLKNAEKRMNNSIKNIDIIILTHIHDDHIKGLNSYLKKYHPVILTQIEKEVLENKINYENIIYDNNYNIDNININLFNLSHDVKCSGISIKENKELIYMTDTGYINNKILKKIENKDTYIIESNHDIEMLRNSKYPFYLQQRILGDKGHLSNEDTAKYLKQIIGENTKNIVLAHLSQENNTPDLALQTTKNKIDNDNITIYIAKQDEALDWIEI